jgi:hypothetical protein
VNGEELYKRLLDTRVPMRTLMKTVDEDGFVRDVISLEVDPETGYILLRLEIQKKNGEIE